MPLKKIKFDMFDTISKIRKEINAERVVFDNLTTFSINAGFFDIGLGGDNGVPAQPTPFDSDRVGGEVPGSETYRGGGGILRATRTSTSSTW